MTNTLAPVERTNWALSTWNSTLDRNDVPFGLGCMVRTICGQLRTSCQKPWPTLWHLWSAPIGHYRPGILPLTGMMSLQLGCMVRTICGQLRTSCLHLGSFSLLPPTHPLVTLVGAHLRKNRLKRLKIKQGTTSKVNNILFNRLLSIVPLNKSGLVRAKPDNFILKSLNRCFTNY